MALNYLTVALTELNAFGVLLSTDSVIPTAIGLFALLLLVYKTCLYTNGIRRLPITYVVNICSNVVPFSSMILNFEYLLIFFLILNI